LPVTLESNPGGVYLRGIRYREDLTQNQLAAMTGIHRRHISEMENGKRPIGKENAKKLAKVLNADYRMML
jgi:transcriptional regulator with XRE-family HTH domain